MYEKHKILMIFVLVGYPSYPGFPGPTPKVESPNIPLPRKIPKIEPTSPWKSPSSALTQDPYQLFGPTSSRLASSGKRIKDTTSFDT